MNDFDKIFLDYICNSGKSRKILIDEFELYESEYKKLPPIDFCDGFPMYTIDSFPFTDFVESLEELEPKPLDIDTQISNIKRQLKYEKNPLVIKNLNRKMNKLIKEKKNV